MRRRELSLAKQLMSKSRDVAALARRNPGFIGVISAEAQLRLVTGPAFDISQLHNSKLRAIRSIIVHCPRVNWFGPRHSRAVECAVR
jgi:hypothetical protein